MKTRIFRVDSQSSRLAVGARNAAGGMLLFEINARQLDEGAEQDFFSSDSANGKSAAQPGF